MAKKNMHSAHAKKLSLCKETLRLITPQDLTAVQGGALTLACPTYDCTQTNSPTADCAGAVQRE
jgi:hypothetical protein